MADNLMGQSIPHLRRWRRGQPVDHRQLNEPVDVLNDMTRGVGVPRQVPGVRSSLKVDLPTALPMPVVITKNNRTNADGFRTLDTAWVEVERRQPGNPLSAPTGRYYAHVDVTGQLGGVFPWPGIPAANYALFTGTHAARVRVSDSLIYSLILTQTWAGGERANLGPMYFAYKPTM